MKKFYICIIILALSFFTSCIYHQIKGPVKTNQITQHNLSTKDYEIIGVVRAEGTIHNVLFLVSWGGSGYEALDRKAKAMGGDDMINFYYNVEKTGLLFIIYNNLKWYARATVIKYRENAVNRKKYDISKNLLYKVDEIHYSSDKASK